MNEKVRIKIAAVVTALFLGAVLTAGVLTHAHPGPRATSSPQKAAATPELAADGKHPLQSYRHHHVRSEQMMSNEVIMAA